MAEAAVVLRIGRNTAYALVRRWKATGGREGIPVIMLGHRRMRVPKAALERMLRGEPELITPPQPMDHEWPPRRRRA